MLQALVLRFEARDLARRLQRLRRWLATHLYELVTGDGGSLEAVKACAEAERVARTYGFRRLTVVMLTPPLAPAEAGDLRAQVVGRLAEAGLPAQVRVFADPTIGASLALVLPDEEGGQ